MTRPLTPKQARFVEEYLTSLNATQAARAAGYSDKGNAAEVRGSELLRNRKVMDAIAAARAERTKRVKVDQDFVLNRLMEEAEGSGPDSNASARIRATELLGKHIGMFVDRHQVEHSGGARVIVELPDDGSTKKD